MTELLNVELLSAQPFQIDEVRLLTALQERCGRTERMIKEGADGFYAYLFPDHPVEYTEGSVPAQVLISTRLPWSPDIGNLQTIFQQSKFWPDAEKVVRSCRYSIKINDLMAQGLPHQQRLKLFNDVIQSLLSVVSCEAIYWITSGQFLPPSLYLSAQANPTTLLFGAVNVRMFNIANRQAGETLMDTIGLSALGLPDIQCHFVNLDPNRVAGWLYNIAAYIFNEGDIILDGQTVDGLTPSDRWQCRHEESIVEPKREVLDINPGSLYNAGRG